MKDKRPLGLLKSIDFPCSEFFFAVALFANKFENYIKGRPLRQITIHVLSKRQITCYMEVHLAMNDSGSINTATDAICVKTSSDCQSVILHDCLSSHFNQHRKGSQQRTMQATDSSPIII